jgi:hypothetical protein
MLQSSARGRNRRTGIANIRTIRPHVINSSPSTYIAYLNQIKQAKQGHGRDTKNNGKLFYLFNDTPLLADAVKDCS